MTQGDASSVFVLITKIIASFDPHNNKSIILLKKIGIREKSHFIKSIKVDNIWLDDCIYAILKEEWGI